MRHTFLVALVLALATSAMAQAPIKDTSIAGIGWLYYRQTGELTDVHFSVSHRLARSVVAITFGLTFHAPDGTVLKTERFRHPFQYEYQSTLVGAPLRRDDVFQVQHSMYPRVQGFCTSAGACGTVQVRVLDLKTE